MLKKLFLILVLAGCSSVISAQVKFGPVLDLGFGMFSKTSDSLELKGGLAPAFGIVIQKDVNYWFSMRGTATYAFKTLQTTKVNGGLKDKLNGQFFDICLAGRFSDFDDDVKTLPYGTAGFGLAFGIVDKLQEKYLKGCTYPQTSPYFTIGAGMGFKMSFFSEIDVSVNYTRYLVPMVTPSLPFDGADARLNQFGLKVAALF